MWGCMVLPVVGSPGTCPYVVHCGVGSDIHCTCVLCISQMKRVITFFGQYLQNSQGQISENKILILS